MKGKKSMLKIRKYHYPIFLIIFILFGLILKLNIDRIQSAETVILNSFKYENDHNLAKLKECYTSRYNKVNFRLDNIASTEVLEIKLLEDQRYYKFYLEYGRGRINNVDRKNIKAYKVKYYVEYKDQTIEPRDSGEYEQAYYLIKENNKGNWKIDSIGVPFYE